jgi:hypothetical protein
MNMAQPVYYPQYNHNNNNPNHSNITQNSSSSRTHTPSTVLFRQQPTLEEKQVCVNTHTHEYSQRFIRNDGMDHDGLPRVVYRGTTYPGVVVNNKLSFYF